MLDLEREFFEAEKEYDLVSFDANPNVVYELMVYHSGQDKADVEDEILCERQTMREIKREIILFSENLTPGMVGIVVIAYEVDDTHPVSAYMIVRKELRN